MWSRSLCLMLLVGVTWTTMVGAKPSPPPPTLEQMVERSQVVVAEYVGCVMDSTKAEAWFTDGGTAEYKLEQKLKGPAVAEKFKVHYSFHDGAFCLGTDPTSPINQPFDEKCLPKKGSRWILFISPGKEGEPYSTCRGCLGRREATQENLEKVRNLLPGEASR